MAALRPVSNLSIQSASSASCSRSKAAHLRLSKISHYRLSPLYRPLRSLSSSHTGATNQDQLSTRPKTSYRYLHSSAPSPSPSSQGGEQSTSKLQPAGLSSGEYHRRADDYIDKLVAQLEELQEDRDEVDVEYSAGVLTLAFPPAGTYVLNKQPPNRQIWLSSPISGPKRYDYVFDATSLSGSGLDPDVGGKGAGDWVYLRDGSSLTQLLEEELGLEMSKIKPGRE